MQNTIRSDRPVRGRTARCSGTDHRHREASIPGLGCTYCSRCRYRRRRCCRPAYYRTRCLKSKRSRGHSKSRSCRRNSQSCFDKWYTFHPGTPGHPSTEKIKYIRYTLKEGRRLVRHCTESCHCMSRTALLSRRARRNTENYRSSPRTLHSGKPCQWGTAMCLSRHRKLPGGRSRSGHLDSQGTGRRQCRNRRRKSDPCCSPRNRGTRSRIR